jgi:hypothetical protein
MGDVLEQRRRESLSGRERALEFLRTPKGIAAMAGLAIVAAAAVWFAVVFFRPPESFEVGQEVPGRFVDDLERTGIDQFAYGVADGDKTVVVDLFEPTPEVVRRDMESKFAAIDISQEGGISEAQALAEFLSEETGKGVAFIYQSARSCDGEGYEAGWVMGGVLHAVMNVEGCKVYDTSEDFLDYVEDRRELAIIPTEIEVFLLEGETPEFAQFREDKASTKDTESGAPRPPEGSPAPSELELTEEQMQTHAGDA